jgi:hypothetical protein
VRRRKGSNIEGEKKEISIAKQKVNREIKEKGNTKMKLSQIKSNSMRLDA